MVAECTAAAARYGAAGRRLLAATLCQALADHRPESRPFEFAQLGVGDPAILAPFVTTQEFSLNALRCAASIPRNLLVDRHVAPAAWVARSDAQILVDDRLLGELPRFDLCHDPTPQNDQDTICELGDEMQVLLDQQHG